MSSDMSPSIVYVPGAGLPIAPPIGYFRGRTNAQVSGQNGHSRVPNTARRSVSEQIAPVGARRLATLEARMPPRDRTVLDRIAEHRFLSTHQIKRFCFVGHATDEAAVRAARSVLSRLERQNLVRSLGRRVGGFRAGSTSKIFQLAPAGARLVYRDGSSYRTHEPSQRFLRHCLAVADVHLALRDHADRQEIETVVIETEPTCWRRYLGQGGDQLWLQPDLAARVVSADYRDHWFIEVDLGTESVPTLLKKCERYEAYRRTGREQERHHAFPLVLWFLESERRRSRLEEAIQRTPRLTPALYRYATPSSFTTLLRSGS